MACGVSSCNLLKLYCQMAGHDCVETCARTGPIIAAHNIAASHNRARLPQMVPVVSDTAPDMFIADSVL
jgi:hypothetical protein